MKKILLLILLLDVLLVKSQEIDVYGGETVNTASLLCINDSLNYICNTNVAPTSPSFDLGCLDYIIHPSWFYIKTSDFDINDIEIDYTTPDQTYIVWGPFDNLVLEESVLLPENIDTCYNGNVTNQNRIYIDDVQPNSYYIVMINNYTNNEMDFNFYVNLGILDCNLDQEDDFEASQYISFPSNNATWVNTHYSIYVDWENPIAEYTLTNVDNFCLNGEDTIIGSKLYTQVKYCEGAYKGALRDENGIVYFCPKDSINEYILYDFTANTGDVLENVYMDDGGYPFLSDMTVMYVDSVMIGGAYRKRLEVEGGEWIEGIGCTQGLFSEPWPNVSYYSLHLNCFSHNDTVFYPWFSQGASCALNVSDKAIESTQISIFPNPASEKVSINLPSFSGEVVIEIYSIDGKLKAVFKEVNKELLINTEAWVKGLYILKVSTPHGVFNRKLVVE
jgi:hypothetical protein